MYINNLLDMVNRKRRNEERAKTAMKFAVGIGIAATIGLAKGILYAPKSGKETREDLKKKAADTLEVIRAKVRSKAEGLKDTTARAAMELQNKLSPKPVAKKKK